jgi:hypothetical protein
LVPLDIGKKQGPVPWPNQTEQRVALECPGSSPTLTNDWFIEFSGEFSGSCSLTVQNTVSALNKNPILAIAKFEVTLKAIISIAPFIRDRSSAGLCDYVPPQFRLARPSESIPVNHTLEYEIHALGPDKQDLGAFVHDRLVVTVDGVASSSPTGSIVVTRPIAITTSPIGTALGQDCSVIDVPLHSLDNEEELLYKRQPTATIVEIFGGSGQFTPKGEGTSIEGRSLFLNPAPSAASRNVQIIDSCVPDREISLIVHTEDIDHIALTGPNLSAVGVLLHFTLSLKSSSGLDFDERIYALMSFAWLPGAMITEDKRSYSWTPTESGVQPIQVTVDEKQAILNVNVYPGLEFINKSIVLFANRSQTFSITGGPPDLSLYEFAVENSSVVRVDGPTCKVFGISAGTTVVTASLENFPPAQLEVNVIEVFGLRIEQTTDTPYIGCLVILRVWLKTSQPDDIFARKVGWEVQGASNWTRDGELLVLCPDKAGTVTVTANCLWFTETINVIVDERLQVSPTHLTLALGTSYAFEVLNNLEVNVTTPDDTGIGTNQHSTLLTANDIGAYAVLVQHKSQWQTITVVVTEPTTIYANSGSNTTHLLDHDGHEYDKHEPIEDSDLLDHQIIPGEPDDTETRHLFDDDDLSMGTEALWGKLPALPLKVRPGRSFQFKVIPPASALDWSGSDGLAVTIEGETGATVTISASDTFTGPGEIQFRHIGTGQQLSVPVEAGWIRKLVVLGAGIMLGLSGAGIRQIL